MEIALMSASLLDRSWDDALDAAVQNGIGLIEACGGGHIPKRHFDPVELAESDSALARFVESLESRKLDLCAFSCHGNPLHPDPAHGQRAHEDFVATCEVASRLEVPFVSLLAGCPGGGPDDRVPNWIIKSTLPQMRDAYEWQWSERVIPYWQEAARIARQHGVKVCIEPHSADVVYGFSTFMRLRGEIGETIGMNFDPSHLWWQGVDPLVFIESAGDAIDTCHVKDALLDRRAIARDGVASAEDYDAWDRRPWAFSTPGYGHSELFWSQFVRALRNVDYDGALSIECEDPFMSADDTLRHTTSVLRRVLPSEPRPAVDWAAVAIG
jgi:sugar phosphate isomerase/epimerase